MTFWPSLVIFILMSPAAAIAEQLTNNASDPWYKIAAGIIAVPAAGIGLLVSWNMMRKTQLETRKLEIEIAEKQSKINDVPDANKVDLLMSPFGRNQRALLIIIRYVLLDITLRLWGVVPSSVNFISKLAMYGYIWIVGPENLSHQGISVITISVMPTVIDALLEVVYWIIFFGIGWPLFKDTCIFLNIPIKSLFDIPRMGRLSRG